MKANFLQDCIFSKPQKWSLISHYRSENTPLFRTEILFLSRSVDFLLQKFSILLFYLIQTIRTTSMNCPFLWLRMPILLWKDSFRLLSSKKCRFYWRRINQQTFTTFFFCWSHFWSPQCKRWPQNTSKSSAPLLRGG